MKMNSRSFLSIFLSVFISVVFGQQTLTINQAIEWSLANNYGVLINQNNLEIASNNKSIFNTGFLPDVTANAGVNYNLSNVNASFQNGTETNLKGASSNALNASVQVSYTLFNGLGRWYQMKSLQEQYQLSELEARATVENTIFQTISAYLNVAYSGIVAEVYFENLSVSQKRLTRAEIQNKYGQNNQLAILNATVDVNNDSIQWQNALVDAQNALRNLNTIMVQDLNASYFLDTSIQFELDLNKSALLDDLMTNNVNLLIAAQNQKNAELGLPMQRANFLPSLAATAQYGWNKNNNNEASFLLSSVNYGLSAGATFQWRLFDGGTSKTNYQNAKISATNAQLQYEQSKLELTRDFETAWADYQNKLLVYQTAMHNLTSSKNNFKRTEENYKLGQVNAIEFRQAQVNLLNAELQVYQNKYQAKLAELTLLQLCGRLTSAY